MIFVRDLLKLDSFKKMELKTGSAGLSRKVSWPNIAQTVSIREWLVGGDVILLSGVGLDITDELLNGMVQQAVEGNAACMIMLKNPSHIPDIPQSTIDLAKKYNFPVFEAPWDTMLSNVIRDISRLEVNDQYIESEKNEFWDGVLTGSLNLSLQMNQEIIQRYRLDGANRLIVIRCNIRNHARGGLEYDEETRRRSVFADIYSAFQRHHHIKFYIYGNNKIIFLLDEDIKEPEIANLLHDIFRRYGELRLHAGISESRTGVQNIQQSYKEAERASMIQADKAVIFYYEMGIYGLLMDIPDQNKIKNYVHKNFREIRFYDEKNQQNLLETLRAYLLCNGNLAETAQLLFIHRNTLVKRVKKIEEITGRSLKKPDVRNLYYNCFMLDEYLNL